MLDYPRLDNIGEKDMEKVLVTCSVNPDLDGYACAVAYAEFLQKTGKIATPGIFGMPDEEVGFLIKNFDLAIPQGENNPIYYDNIVLVDASIISGLDRRIDPLKVKEVIDHREVNDSQMFTKADIQIERVGAAATLIAEKFYSKLLPISALSQILLYFAIISNTLNFKANTTTERDVKMANWLKEKLKVNEKLIHEVFLAKSDFFGDKLGKKIRSSFTFYNFKGHKVGIAQLEMIGVEKLVQSRQQEIQTILRELFKEMDLEVIFASALDLEANKNCFIVIDKLSEVILREILNLNFHEGVAWREGLIMRKEINPKLKTYFA